MYWKNDWAGFFIVYFKWTYYLCVTPFRLTWVEKEKRFRLDTNWFQKIFCGLMYFLLAMWYLKDLRKIPVDDLYRNPVVYFSLAFNINAVYYHNILLVIIFWRKQERFLALVNFDCDGYAGSTLKKRLIAEFLCFFFAILPIICTLSGYRVVAFMGPQHPSMLFRCLVLEGRFGFFLTRSMDPVVPCNDGNPPSFDELSPLDVFVAVLAFLMEASRQIVGFYSDFFPLICCISLWICTGSITNLLDEHENAQDPTGEDPPYNNMNFNFHRRLSLRDHLSNGFTTTTTTTGIILPHISPTPTHHQLQEKSISAPVPPPSSQDEKKELPDDSTPGGSGTAGLKGNVLLERYEVCKAFSKRVNRALGQLLFVYVLSSIMYLSTCMDAVLVLEDWFGKLRVAFFFSIFILMFFVGSEIVNKVYGVREWLCDPFNNTFLPEKNLLVLIHEVTCKSIGISGNGMFVITYSTFMTVMTTTVTFFIIILQFQENHKPNDSDDFLQSMMPLIQRILRNSSIAENI